MQPDQELRLAETLPWLREPDPEPVRARGGVSAPPRTPPPRASTSPPLPIPVPRGGLVARLGERLPRRRGAIAVIGAAGILAGGYTVTSSQVVEPAGPTQATPQGETSDGWAARAQVTLTSVDRQLDTIAQTEAAWNAMPEHETLGTPVPVAEMMNRKALLERRKAALQSQLDNYRALSRARADLEISERNLDAVERALRETPTTGAVSSPDQASALAALQEQRDLRLRQRDAKRLELAGLEGNVEKAAHAPLPDDGQQTTAVSDEVMDVIHSGGHGDGGGPTVPDPGPQRPDLVSGGREGHQGKERQATTTSAPPDPRGPRDESAVRPSGPPPRASGGQNADAHGSPKGEDHKGPVTAVVDTVGGAVDGLTGAKGGGSKDGPKGAEGNGQKDGGKRDGGVVGAVGDTVGGAVDGLTGANGGGSKDGAKGAGGNGQKDGGSRDGGVVGAVGDTVGGAVGGLTGANGGGANGGAAKDGAAKDGATKDGAANGGGANGGGANGGGAKDGAAMDSGAKDGAAKDGGSGAGAADNGRARTGASPRTAPAAPALAPAPAPAPQPSGRGGSDATASPRKAVPAGTAAAAANPAMEMAMAIVHSVPGGDVAAPAVEAAMREAMTPAAGQPGSATSGGSSHTRSTRTSSGTDTGSRRTTSTASSDGTSAASSRTGTGSTHSGDQAPAAQTSGTPKAAGQESTAPPSGSQAPSEQSPQKRSPGADDGASSGSYGATPSRTTSASSSSWGTWPSSSTASGTSETSGSSGSATGSGHTGSPSTSDATGPDAP